MTLFDGLTSRTIETPRLVVGILERAGDDATASADQTVILVHTALSANLTWQELMQDLPSDLRVVALDLRGFGGSESLPVDPSRGVRDFSDDLRATLLELGIDSAHLVGWGLGAAVALQYALDFPVRSLTLESGIGSAFIVDPDFLERLTSGDVSTDAPTSPRSVFRSGFVAEGYTSEHEDVWIDAMRSTSTAEGNYPGGVLEALASFDASGVVAIEPKPPILWIHGTADTLLPELDITRTREVLNAYVAAGGEVHELALDGVGHTPHLERPAQFRRALLQIMGYLGRPQNPAPPTEAIVIPSSD